MEVGSIKRRILSDFEQKYSLSQREVEILKECIEGRSVKEMSNTIYLSRPAISYHTSKLLKKLGVENRNQIILRILEWFVEQEKAENAKEREKNYETTGVC